jgi:hypothetical protein
MITLTDFIHESNKIEGIAHQPTLAELKISTIFLDRITIVINDLVDLVAVFQPEARLRSQPGMSVRIGNYYPEAGGDIVVSKLSHLLKRINEDNITAYEAHTKYENLHPFTDGNGRSGRMLWLWQMGSTGFELPFLHMFYYQTLENIS